MYVMVYIDDLLIAGKDDKAQLFLKRLADQLQLKHVTVIAQVLRMLNNKHINPKVLYYSLFQLQSPQNTTNNRHFVQQTSMQAIR
eukprot:4447076-Amphidinium_carterae.1